jgi:hypothetical protein
MGQALDPITLQSHEMIPVYFPDFYSESGLKSRHLAPYEFELS